MNLRSYVRKRVARRMKVPEIPFALERLAAVKFQPQLIFDVGAYQGDFARCCLNIWPTATVACFEALDHRLHQLHGLSSRDPRIRVLPGLLGAKARQQVPFHECETGSSVLEEHVMQGFPITLHSMRTVDQTVHETFGDHAPDFLKLDVQGYELEVLKGAEQALPFMQVILAEINLLDIHSKVPLLAEVVAWLDTRDWVAYDICGLTRRPLDQALWQADLIFVKRNSSFRSDKRWAA